VVTDVTKWLWRRPASKCQIQDYQIKDRMSVCKILLLQWKPKLGRTKLSTGSHATVGFDIAGSVF